MSMRPSLLKQEIQQSSNSQIAQIINARRAALEMSEISGQILLSTISTTKYIMKPTPYRILTNSAKSPEEKSQELGKSVSAVKNYSKLLANFGFVPSKQKLSIKNIETLLRDSEKSIKEISDELEISMTNAHTKVKSLKNSGRIIVSSSKIEERHRTVYYKLNPKS